MIKEYRMPRHGEVASYLARHVSWMKQYGDELRFNPCPHCGDNKSNPSIQVNVKSGLWRCFKCGRVGNYPQMARAFQDPVPDPWKEETYHPFDNVIIERFVTETRRPVHDGHYPGLVDYCEGRGIGIETMKAWRISSKGDKAIRWPIYAVVDGRWVIVNMKVRSIDPDASTRDWFDVKGGPTDLLIGNHLIDEKGPRRAIIFEGQWDAMTAYEMGIRNVFSLPSGASNVHVSGMLRYIPDDWEIWVCTDMDEAGNKAAEQFYASLSTERLKRLKLPYKDLNEWYKIDPFITERDLIQTSSQTDHFFLDEKDDGLFLKFSLDEKIDPTTRLITETPWDSLNEKISGGFYRGQTTSFLGQSGGGKTTLVNQIGVYTASNKITTGLISVESDRESLKIKLQDVIRGSIDQDAQQGIERHLLVSKLHGIGISKQMLMGETSRMIQAGARVIIVDNLDYICRNDHDLKSQIYLTLSQLAIENQIHVIVVWQPNKIGRSQWISSGNQKGYSSSLQDSDNYITMNRTLSGVCLHIEKTREHGIGIGDDKVWFDWDPTARIYRQQIRSTKIPYEGKLINLF